MELFICSPCSNAELKQFFSQIRIVKKRKTAKKILHREFDLPPILELRSKSELDRDTM